MTTTGWTGAIDVADVAALGSIGAGAIHAAAAGIHAENPTLVAAVRPDRGRADPRRAGAAAPARPGRGRRRRRSSTPAPSPPGSSPARPGSRGSTGSSSPSRRSSPTPCAPGSGRSPPWPAVVALVRHTTTVRARQPHRARRRPRCAQPGGDDGRRDERAQPRARPPGTPTPTDVARRRRLAQPHVGRRRRREATEHTHSSEPAADRARRRPRRPRRPSRARQWPGHGLGPDGADRLLRRRRRHRRAAGAGRDPRRQHARATCRRSPTSRTLAGARLPVDRRRRDGLRALHQRRLHRRRLVPRPDPTGVARVPGRRRRSARWCRPCSSPRTSRSTTPSSSTAAGR